MNFLVLVYYMCALYFFIRRFTEDNFLYVIAGLLWMILAKLEEIKDEAGDAGS